MAPIYEYDCGQCRSSFEKFSPSQLSVQEDDTSCPTCGQTATRVPSRANWISGGSQVRKQKGELIVDVHPVFSEKCKECGGEHFVTGSSIVHAHIDVTTPKGDVRLN